MIICEESILETHAPVPFAPQDDAYAEETIQDIFSLIAHDLKEPIRNIHQLISYTTAENLPEHQDRMTHLAVRAERLLSDALHYTNVLKEEERYSEEHIGAIATDVIHAYTALTDIVLEGYFPTLRCHRIQISEVFRCLVSNGFLYNDSRDKRIIVGAIPPTASCRHTVFYVKDNGIGIPEKHHRSVFRMCKRLQHRDIYGYGSGIGLTVAQKIIHYHGGQIWLASSPGKGTIVYFTIGTL